ncbi:MAG: TolB family protein [Egibacteraceae bacterium]
MPAERNRRPVTAAAVAAVIVVAAFGGIVLFGRLSVPSYPSLTDHPDPSIPGTIAFWRTGRSPCLSLVPARGGQVRELWCKEHAETSRPEWTVDGNLVVRTYSVNGPEHLTIDGATGEVLERRAGSFDAYPQPTGADTRGDGTRAVIDDTEGKATLSLVAPSGRPRPLLVAHGPRNYAFLDARWSPDGSWLLVTDSKERVLVVDSATGTARVLVSHGQSPTWSPPEPVK